MRHGFEQVPKFLDNPPHLGLVVLRVTLTLDGGHDSVQQDPLHGLVVVMSAPSMKSSAFDTFVVPDLVGVAMVQSSADLSSKCFRYLGVS